MSTERDRPRPATTPAIPPPAWPGALVGAALGGVVGALSLLVPVDPTPLGTGPSSTTGTGAPMGTGVSTGTGAPVAPTATASATASASGGASATASSGSASGSAADAEADYLARATGLLRTAPAEALALAEGHAARFPDSTLGQEREMIAINALAALGRKPEARARAKLFLTLFPGSAHRPRIEELLPELGDKTPQP